MKTWIFQKVTRETWKEWAISSARHPTPDAAPVALAAGLLSICTHLPAFALFAGNHHWVVIDISLPQSVQEWRWSTRMGMLSTITMVIAVTIITTIITNNIIINIIIIIIIIIINIIINIIIITFNIVMIMILIIIINIVISIIIINIIAFNIVIIANFAIIFTSTEDKDDQLLTLRAAPGPQAVVCDALWDCTTRTQWHWSRWQEKRSRELCRQLSWQ